MAAPSSDEENFLRRIVYGEFTEKRVLANGSHCDVYSAKHPSFGKCCLRVFSKVFISRDRIKQKLESEVNSLARFEHPQLVKILAFVMESQHLCQVLEFVHYGTLSDALRRIEVPVSLKIRIAYEITEVMSYLHAENPPIVHRKLKTSNILLDENFHIKLSDLAMPDEDQWTRQASHQKDITDRRKQATGDMSMFNQPGHLIAHIPPENIRNINRKPTPPFDVFSYGVLLWEMMADKHPYGTLKTDVVFQYLSDGVLLTEDGLKPNSPRILCDIMLRTFTLEPEDRQTFQVIRSHLAPHVDEAAASESEPLCRHHYDEYFRRKRAEREASRTFGGVVPVQAEPTPVAPPPQGIPIGPRRPYIAQRTPTVLVNPDPRPALAQQERSQSTPTIRVNREPVSGRGNVIAQPTPTVLVHPQPMGGDEDGESSSNSAGPKSFYEPQTAPSCQQAQEAPGESHPVPSAPPQEAMDTVEQTVGISSESSMEIGGPASDERTDCADPFLDNSTAGRQRAATTDDGATTSRSPPPHENVNVNINVDINRGATFEQTRNVIRPEQIPGYGSTRAMVFKDIDVVANNIGAKWKKMARFMRISDGGIDAINHDHDREGLYEKAYQSVKLWEKRHGRQVAVGEIVDLLVQMQEHHIAALISP